MVHRLSRIPDILPSGCWKLPHRPGTEGYILFWLNGKNVLAHRWFYQDRVGPIPPGLTLDHTCRNRWCVNPGHLEPVTTRENTLRGIGASALNAQKSKCLKGHPLSGANLYTPPNGRFWRHCRTCQRAHEKRYRQRRKLEAAQ